MGKGLDESSDEKKVYLYSGISMPSDSATETDDACAIQEQLSVLRKTPVSYGLVKSHPVTKQHSRINSMTPQVINSKHHIMTARSKKASTKKVSY